MEQEVDAGVLTLAIVLETNLKHSVKGSRETQRHMNGKMLRRCGDDEDEENVQTN